MRFGLLTLDPSMLLPKSLSGARLATWLCDREKENKTEKSSEKTFRFWEQLGGKPFPIGVTDG